MSHQLTFADSEFNSSANPDQKRDFAPAWSRFCHGENMVEVIEPFYPKGW